MIKLKKTEIFGWEAAIRGMRNPMNSWENSDSIFIDNIDGDYHDIIGNQGPTNDWYGQMRIGANDINLMKSLAIAGTEHSKYRRMIVVYVDITAPLYWWKEFDTYKVGTVANSCSTMHKIASKPFELDDFSHEHLTKAGIEHLETTVELLNEYRNWYLKYGSMQEKDKIHFDEIIKTKKDLWWQMIQLLPSSYNQKRTVMLNYENLSAMYHQRKDHKLDEWRTFCGWIIDELPYSEDLIVLWKYKLC